MTEIQNLATSGEAMKIDYASIEQSLSEMWRGGESGEHAVTRAALWNVVAHTSSAAQHAEASAVLSHAAAAVPQRTIVVRADRDAPSDMSSWISANCHEVSDGRQVCSEEIAIVAGGSHIARVPPLVNALLIPDMPVAVWWVGDLPQEQASYVDSLLEPADRLIIDSASFDGPADLSVVERVSKKTFTAPADLNWIRGEDWRTATAAVFDPPAMRKRIHSLSSVNVVADVTDVGFFGQWLEGIFYAAWLICQSGRDADAVETTFDFRPATVGGLAKIELDLDGVLATVTRDVERRVITSSVAGHEGVPEGVTRMGARRLDELIVRELKAPESNRLLVRVLPMAIMLAARIPR